MKSKKKKTACQNFKEFLYEFYTQILMQNNFSFAIWVICYVISFFQMLDYIFHPFFDELLDESFVTNCILQVFQYCSVPLRNR